LLKNTVLLVL